MSVTNTYTPILSTGDGAETDFDFGFLIFNASDLVVALVDPDTLVATAQAISTNYTVVIDTAAPGGTVTFLIPPPDGTLVSIRRDVPITQATDIPSGGLFREEQIENALDKEILIAQQLNEKIDRAILQNPYTAAITLVYPAASANKIIGWNAAGTGLENKEPIDADAASSAMASMAAAATSALEAATSAAQALAGISVHGAFTATDLSATGKLTITHNRALTAPYAVMCKIFDNDNQEIWPDSFTGLANSVIVGLTSFSAAMTGTWGYVYIA